MKVYIVPGLFKLLLFVCTLHIYNSEMVSLRNSFLDYVVGASCLYATLPTMSLALKNCLYQFVFQIVVAMAQAILAARSP